MRFRALAASLTALFLVALPQPGMAHPDYSPGPDAPGITEPAFAEPIADADVQKMAFDMERARCEHLMNLKPEVRSAFLVTIMFLQRKGSLSRIVGPDCMFFGEAERVAAIADSALTLGSDRESLYFLPEMHALIISHTAKNSVAYGMMIDDEAADPVEYFLAHRDEAEESAAVARIFAENVMISDPPRAALPELATEIRTAPSASQTDSPLAERTPSNAATSSAPGAGIAMQEELAQNYVTASSAPSARPIGPTPELAQETGSGLWILAALFALIGIGTLIVVLKHQVSPKQGYVDE